VSKCVSKSVCPIVCIQLCVSICVCVFCCALLGNDEAQKLSDVYFRLAADLQNKTDEFIWPLNSSSFLIHNFSINFYKIFAFFKF